MIRKAAVAGFIVALALTGCTFTIYRDGYSLAPTKHRPTCDSFVLEDDVIAPPPESKRIGAVLIRPEARRCSRKATLEALGRQTCAAGGNLAIVTDEIRGVSPCAMLEADLWRVPVDFLVKARSIPPEEPGPLGNIRVKSK